MSKAVALFLIVGAALLSYPAARVIDTHRANTISQEEVSTKLNTVVIPPSKDLLAIDSPATQDLPVETKLILESKNTAVLRGPVTGSSVAKAIREISQISRNLSKSDVIYLVLDTPGGSVTDGADFIDFLSAVPQEVRTVTLFAASMGFQIVENNKGKRLITRQGVLMSHRARGGLEGQFDGEFETRYRMIKRQLDFLETVDANRMGLTLAEYRAKIKDELWVHGFDSKSEKVADAMVSLACGETLTGEETITIDTMFGPVGVVFDRCPLLRDPVRIEMNRVRNDAQGYILNIVSHMFTARTNFVKDFIVTNRYEKIFK